MWAVKSYLKYFKDYWIELSYTKVEEPKNKSLNFSRYSGQNTKSKAVISLMNLSQIWGGQSENYFKRKYYSLE